jgi:transcription elongation GreA/GreB family factor
MRIDALLGCAVPSKLPPKSAVREALRALLAEAHARAVSAASATRDGAVHEESRAEGDKDMRSTEQSYLARGQAMRVEELAEQLQRIELAPLREYGEADPIGPFALVRVSVDEEQRTFFVVPFGGGAELEVSGARITVVTASSPVGAALMGRRAGEDFELRTRGAAREWVVEEIR